MVKLAVAPDGNGFGHGGLTGLRSKAPPMLKDVLRKAGAGAAAVILAAFAGGVAFVAAGFALFAVLERVVSIAGAAALTALAFAIVTAVIAFLAPALGPRRRHLTAVKPKMDADTVRLASEAGMILLGLAGDLALSHRLKREERSRGRKR